MAGVGLPHAAMAEQVQRGIDLVVHLERRADGARRGHRDRRGRAGGRGDRGPHDRRDAGDRGSGLLPALAGAAAGGLLALAAREALLASPAAARWLRLALEPLRRAGREGYAPSTLERRRLAALGAGAAVLGGWFLAGLGAGAAALGRRPGAGRLGDLQPPPPLPRARSSARCRKSRPRSPTRSAPAARCAPRCRPPPRSLDGPPAVELARLGAELDLGARDRRGGRGLAAADALGAGRRLRRGAAQPAARRRRPGRAAAPLRRRRGGARPGGRGRPLGDRAGPLHRPAGGGDAERRRPLRRADPARLPRQAARLAARGGAAGAWPRRCSSPASSRSGGSRGWSSERRRAAGGAGGPARLRRRPRAARRSQPARRCRRCRSACAGARPRAALRLGLPERLRRSGLEARLPLAAVLPRSSPAAPAAASRRWPRRRRRRAGPRCWSRSRCRPPASSSPTRCWSGRRAGASAACSPPCPMPSTCSRSAPAPAAARRPGCEQLARAGEGPLAEELRLTVAELSCGVPLGARPALAARPRPRQRAGDAGRLDRALAPLRLAAGRAAAPPGQRPAPRQPPRRRGARRPRRAEDPARRRPRPRPLGPADDRRRPDRQRRHPARRVLSDGLVAPEARRIATPATLRAGAWRRRRWRRAIVVQLRGVLLVAVDVAAEGAVDQLEGELLGRRVGQPDDEGGGEELAQPVRRPGPCRRRSRSCSSSASLSSLTRSLEPRKASSKLSSARRPNLRWQ